MRRICAGVKVGNICSARELVSGSPRMTSLIWLYCGSPEIISRISVVDQIVGQCKTEASRKPVVMNEHISKALTAWRQESVYTAPGDWVWASVHKQGTQPLWLSTIMRYYIQPAARRIGINKKIGWHTFRHTFSTLIKSMGVDAKVVQELLRQLHSRRRWSIRRLSNHRNARPNRPWQT